MEIKINDRLYKEIITYCELNNIDNIDNYINNIIKKGFTIDVYGETPLFVKKNNKIEEEKMDKSVVEIQEIVEKSRVPEEALKNSPFSQENLFNNSILNDYVDKIDITTENTIVTEIENKPVDLPQKKVNRRILK